MPRERELKKHNIFDTYINYSHCSNKLQTTQFTMN